MAEAHNDRSSDDRAKEQRRRRKRDAAETGADLGAGMAGTGAALGGAALLGPPGALLGPGASVAVRRFLRWRRVEQTFETAAERFARRELNERELARARIAYEHAIRGIAGRLELGEALRNDGFFDRPRSADGHIAGEEVLEGVLRAASEAHEERKAERVGDLYAFLAFQPDITPGHAMQLLALAERLTYEQLLLLGAFASDQVDLPEWTPTGAFTPRETGLVTAILGLARESLVLRADHRHIGSFVDVSPAQLKTVLNGALLVEAMELTKAESEDWEALLDVFRRLGTIDANEPTTRLDVVVPPGSSPDATRAKIDKRLVRFSEPGLRLEDLPAGHAES